MVLSSILQAETAEIGQLNVQGNATVGGSLAVLGSLIINTNLTVKGNTTLETLTVNQATVFRGDITIAGHIITVGNQPQLEVLTSVLGATTIAPTITIDGNDTSGTLQVDTSSLSDPLPAGDIVKVIFRDSFSKKPKVFINQYNDNALGLQVYKESTTNYFILKSAMPLDPNKLYIFDYFVIE